VIVCAATTRTLVEPVGLIAAALLDRGEPQHDVLAGRRGLPAPDHVICGQAAAGCDPALHRVLDRGPRDRAHDPHRPAR